MELIKDIKLLPVNIVLSIVKFIRNWYYEVEFRKSEQSRDKGEDRG